MWALKPHTAIIEISTKVAAYNCDLNIGDAAVRAMRGHPSTGPPRPGWAWMQGVAS